MPQPSDTTLNFSDSVAVADLFQQPSSFSRSFNLIDFSFDTRSLGGEEFRLKAIPGIVDLNVAGYAAASYRAGLDLSIFTPEVGMEVELAPKHYAVSSDGSGHLLFNTTGFSINSARVSYQGLDLDANLVVDVGLDMALQGGLSLKGGLFDLDLFDEVVSLVQTIELIDLTDGIYQHGIVGGLIAGLLFNIDNDLSSLNDRSFSAGPTANLAQSFEVISSSQGALHQFDVDPAQLLLAGKALKLLGGDKLSKLAQFLIKNGLKDVFDSLLNPSFEVDETLVQGAINATLLRTAAGYEMTPEFTAGFRMVGFNVTLTDDDTGSSDSFDLGLGDVLDITALGYDAADAITLQALITPYFDIDLHHGAFVELGLLSADSDLFIDENVPLVGGDYSFDVGLFSQKWNLTDTTTNLLRYESNPLPLGGALNYLVSDFITIAENSPTIVVPEQDYLSPPSGSSGYTEAKVVDESDTVVRSEATATPENGAKTSVTAMQDEELVIRVSIYGEIGTHVAVRLVGPNLNVTLFDDSMDRGRLVLSENFRGVDAGTYEIQITTDDTIEFNSVLEHFSLRSHPDLVVADGSFLLDGSNGHLAAGPAQIAHIGREGDQITPTVVAGSTGANFTLGLANESGQVDRTDINILNATHRLDVEDDSTDNAQDDQTSPFFLGNNSGVQALIFLTESDKSGGSSIAVQGRADFLGNFSEERVLAARFDQWDTDNNTVYTGAGENIFDNASLPRGVMFSSSNSVLAYSNRGTGDLYVHSIGPVPHFNHLTPEKRLRLTDYDVQQGYDRYHNEAVDVAIWDDQAELAMITHVIDRTDSVLVTVVGTDLTVQARAEIALPGLTDDLHVSAIRHSDTGDILIAYRAGTYGKPMLAIVDDETFQVLTTTELASGEQYSSDAELDIEIVETATGRLLIVYTAELQDNHADYDVTPYVAGARADGTLLFSGLRLAPFVDHDERWIEIATSRDGLNQMLVSEVDYATSAGGDDIYARSLYTLSDRPGDRAGSGEAPAGLAILPLSKLLPDFDADGDTLKPSGAFNFDPTAVSSIQLEGEFGDYNLLIETAPGYVGSTQFIVEVTDGTQSGTLTIDFNILEQLPVPILDDAPTVERAEVSVPELSYAVLGRENILVSDDHDQGETRLFVLDAAHGDLVNSAAPEGMQTLSQYRNATGNQEAAMPFTVADLEAGNIAIISYENGLAPEITLALEDTGGNSTSFALEVDLIPVNETPLKGRLDSSGIVEGSRYLGQAVGVDPDGDSLVYSVLSSSAPISVAGDQLYLRADALLDDGAIGGVLRATDPFGAFVDFGFSVPVLRSPNNPIDLPWSGILRDAGNGQAKAYRGTGGDDRLYHDGMGTVGTVIEGGGGFDRVYKTGDDPLNAIFRTTELISTGAGDDFLLFEGDAASRINSGDGSDFVTAEGAAAAISAVLGRGNDVGWAGDGNSRLYGGDGIDILTGGAGDDLLVGNRDLDHLYGGAGNDRLFADYADFVSGFAQIFGGAGFDRVFVRDSNTTGFANIDLSAQEIEGAYGAAGSDRFDGTGLQRDIYLLGYGGDDELFGGVGNDYLAGGNGADLIDGSAGNDTLLGGSGEDTMSGGDGNDIVRGDAGKDTLLGGGGDDSVYADQADASFNGDAGYDTLRLSGNNGFAVDLASTGFEIVYGSDGHDTFDGANVSDNEGIVLYGLNGDDSLTGSAFGDLLYGGDGDDVITRSAGDDIIDGGAGMDTLIVQGSRNDFEVGYRSDGSFGFIRDLISGDLSGLRNVESILFDDQTL